MTRRQIIFDTIKELYPEIAEGAVDSLAEDIDTHWHILKKNSLDGVDGEWTLSGHVRAYIADRLSVASKAALASYRILARMQKEGLH